MRIQQYGNRLWLPVLFVNLVIFIGFFMTHYISFYYGCGVSAVNLGLFVIFSEYYKKKSTYQGEALSAVAKTTVIRFATAISLLAYGLKWLELNPEALMIGFILGQLFFLSNQLTMVVTKDVK